MLKTFTFPRQPKEPFLCLADFLRPVDSGEMDYVGFLVVTAGKGVRELSEEWKQKGEYLRSHALQAAALETAEAFAERVHHIMRDIWGFPDPPEMTMQQRHGARYQGIRVSFGYPACPNLEDQELLFDLMQPQDIGVQLTDGYMMGTGGLRFRHGVCPSGSPVFQRGKCDIIRKMGKGGLHGTVFSGYGGGHPEP